MEEPLKKRKKQTKQGHFLLFNGVKVPYPKPAKQFSSNGSPLYCICKKADNGELMVGCDECEDWYHFDCLRLDKRYEKLYYKFYCPYCQEDRDKVSLYHRKCVLSGCYLATAPGLKFCSKEHGIEHFQRIRQAMPNNDAGIFSYVLKNGLDLQSLKALGDTFPEPDPAEFELFVSQYPEYDEERGFIEELIRNVDKQLAYYALRLEYLNILSTFILEINSYLSSLDSGAKKPKKIEVCGFDRVFSLTLRQLEKRLGNTPLFSGLDIMNASVTPQDHLSQQLDALKEKITDLDSLEELQDSKKYICLKEKKKCSKHQRWVDRVKHEAETRMNELEDEKRRLEKQKDKLVRRFQIEFWDQDEGAENTLEAEDRVKDENGNGGLGNDKEDAKDEEKSVTNGDMENGSAGSMMDKMVHV